MFSYGKISQSPDEVKALQEKTIQQAQDKEAAAKKSIDDWGANYLGGPPGISFSNDEAIRQGQMIGMDSGKLSYGQNKFETGQNVQDIIQRRRAMLNQTDPASDQIRQGANAQVRNLRAQGINNPAQINAIQRQARSDIAGQLYGQQNQSLSNYQKLIGNVLSGQNQLEMGWSQLQKSGETPPALPSSGGFLGDSVICTELSRQGYMSDQLLVKDRIHGMYVEACHPYVYSGYLILATPVVRAMRKSQMLTKIIALPALCWAHHIAGNKNLPGLIINTIGSAICSIVGRLANEISREERI
jgi:hypothetical protein